MDTLMSHRVALVIHCVTSTSLIVEMLSKIIDSMFLGDGGTSMLVIIDAIQRIGWLIIWPLVWVMAITIVPSIMFWSIRRWWLDSAAFGTELFAILFTADLMVALGLVDAWLLGECVKGSTWYCDGAAMAEWIYRIAAWILLLGTMYAAIVAVQYEKRSIELWRTLSSDASVDGQLTSKPWFKLDRWWVRAAMLRWTLAWMHMLWIVKAPRLNLFI
jgi:hypothetical protein